MVARPARGVHSEAGGGAGVMSLTCASSRDTSVTLAMTPIATTGVSRAMARHARDNFSNDVLRRSNALDRAVQTSPLAPGAPPHRVDPGVQPASSDHVAHQGERCS